MLRKQINSKENFHLQIYAVIEPSELNESHFYVILRVNWGEIRLPRPKKKKGQKKWRDFRC